MRICYLGNYENKNSDSTEKHIKYAFEQLGHEVIPVDEANFTAKDVIDACKDVDLFFFHQGNIKDMYGMQRMMEILTNVTCKKVFWYFDKVWNGRDEIISNILPYVDWGFLTDGTWIRRNPGFKNISQLMQGIGNEDLTEGKEREEFKCDIAYTGGIPPYRQQLIQFLTETYGDKFKIFNNVFNRDLFDLCASAKVIVAPKEPQDDFYWSSRIYLTLGSGGFMIHPNFEGLKEELTEGEHFIGYTDLNDLKKKINKFLKNSSNRKQIQEAGTKKVQSEFTYQDRIKKLLEKING